MVANLFWIFLPLLLGFKLLLIVSWWKGPPRGLLDRQGATCTGITPFIICIKSCHSNQSAMHLPSARPESIFAQIKVDCGSIWILYDQLLHLEYVRDHFESTLSPGWHLEFVARSERWSRHLWIVIRTLVAGYPAHLNLLRYGWRVTSLSREARTFKAKYIPYLSNVNSCRPI